MEEPQRNHPCNFRWHRIPCAHPCERVLIPCVKTWKKPITIARHAYGDVYKNVEMKIPGAGKAELVYTAEDGTGHPEKLFMTLTAQALFRDIHNTNSIYQSFARACFKLCGEIQSRICGLLQRIPFPKNMTIPSRIFSREIYEQEYKEKFEELGIEYFYTLIDDAVARVMKSRGRLYLGLQEL